MTTPTPGLDRVKECLKTASQERRASLLMLSAASLELQRMCEAVQAGSATDDGLMREAAALLGAALSTPYRPLPECHDASLSRR
ncbi:hypothetical protein [uncultured Methylobacterium sp.]|uniref:hypothetical protein n=1 Tax=uncultured Methylobacterium sp. TaxID=157278 RepID=UPI0035CA2541